MQVCAVPGPTAFATALAVAGLPTGRFTFEGFLSTNKPSRRKHLESLLSEERTMGVLRSAAQTACDVRRYSEIAQIALVRELTKMHETIERTTLSAACEKYKETPPKGEFVLVVSGAEPLPDAKWTLDEAVAFAKKQVEKGVSKNEAAKIAAKESGIKKSDIYKALTQ